MHEYLLSVVKHIRMKEVYASIQPTFKVPGQNTIKKDIFKMYKLEKLNMTKLMDENDSRVALQPTWLYRNVFSRLRQKDPN
ncbi:hypothetical protein Ahy_A10g049440 [Arachis hypogaea]|uniref:Uncharacterized protein n=1 Tax=Arachis hypogaea TaxID=3818 RepID=A0A445B759_ARAHY|nr:hypothetical protein Ahy_A10g049440 [Arachis hypogaea]